MSDQQPADAIGTFFAAVSATQLATIDASHLIAGENLTKLYLIKRGEHNPYNRVVVELADGTDAGKRFYANVQRSYRFSEPYGVTLLKEYIPE